MGKHVVFVTWKLGNAPAFEAAKRLGHEVTVIRSRKMEQAQNIDLDATPYRRFADTVHMLEDATDIDALRARVRAIHSRRPIDGFLATVDALVLPVARIAEELGIPFTTRHGAETAKLKHRCRQRLAEAGVDRTRFQVVTGLDQALAFAASTGYPVVLKPASGSGSEGAHVLADEAELRERFARMEEHRELYGAGVLLEECLVGEFVSAEIGICRDRVLRLAVSDRKTWEGHPALELGVTIPAPISADRYETVMAFAERVMRAVDLRLGIFHIEVMLTADGPRLIELNPRLMGSCLPNLFCLAGGGDLFELLVRVYLDEDVRLEDVSFSRFATVRWFGAARAEPRPPQPDLSWTARYGDALRSIHVRYPSGEVLQPCRGNLGNFGEVQVAHECPRSSVAIAEEIVEQVEAQLGIRLTR
jgi:biotin carboxylase